MVRKLKGGIRTELIRRVLVMGVSVRRRSHNRFTEGCAC